MIQLFVILLHILALRFCLLLPFGVENEDSSSLSAINRGVNLEQYSYQDSRHSISFNLSSLIHHIVVAHPSSISTTNWFLKFLPQITEVLALCYTLCHSFTIIRLSHLLSSWFSQFMLLKACSPAASNLTMPRQRLRVHLIMCNCPMTLFSMRWTDSLFNSVTDSPLLWFYILSRLLAPLSIVLLLLRGFLLYQQDLTPL